jgi:hypothetical protein
VVHSGRGVNGSDRIGSDLAHTISFTTYFSRIQIKADIGRFQIRIGNGADSDREQKYSDVCSHRLVDIAFANLERDLNF